MATQKASSHQGNDAYLKMRADYRAKLADMIITIKDEWYADKANNILDGPKIRNGLEISIPEWDNPPPDDGIERDLLRIELDKGDGVWRLIGEPIPFTVKPGDPGFPPGTFPYEYTIPNDDLPRNATCRLRYTVESYNNNIPFPSQITPLIVDQIAPNEDKEPVELVLASSDLDDSNLPPGGKLAMTLKGYPDWKATDNRLLSVSANPGGASAKFSYDPLNTLAASGEQGTEEQRFYQNDELANIRGAANSSFMRGAGNVLAEQQEDNDPKS